jgi:hypothetical protein
MRLSDASFDPSAKTGECVEEMTCVPLVGTRSTRGS